MAIIMDKNEVKLVGLDAIRYRDRHGYSANTRYLNGMEFTGGELVSYLGVDSIPLTTIRDKVNSIKGDNNWGGSIDKLIIKYLEVIYLVYTGRINDVYRDILNFIYNKEEDVVKVCIVKDTGAGVIGEDFTNWVYCVIGYLISDIDPLGFETYTIDQYMRHFNKEESYKYMGYMMYGGVKGLMNLIDKDKRLELDRYGKKIEVKDRGYIMDRDKYIKYLVGG